MVALQVPLPQQCLRHNNNNKQWIASSPVHQAQTLQVGGKQPSPPGHITSGGRAAQSTKHKHYRWGASSPAHLVTLRVEGEQPSPPSTNITGGGGGGGGGGASSPWSHYEWRASSPVLHYTRKGGVYVSNIPNSAACTTPI